MEELSHGVVAAGRRVGRYKGPKCDAAKSDLGPNRTNTAMRHKARTHTNAQTHTQTQYAYSRTHTNEHTHAQVNTLKCIVCEHALVHFFCPMLKVHPLLQNDASQSRLALFDLNRILSRADSHSPSPVKEKNREQGQVVTNGSLGNFFKFFSTFLL